jgi:hypothetical protein
MEKDCTEYAGKAGDHCTVTISNFATIPTGSHIFYDQAAGVPTGVLDSNIVLDAGTVTEGWAVAPSISRPVSGCARFPMGPERWPGSLPVSMSRVRAGPSAL